VSKLASRSAFHGLTVPGRFGKANGDPGVTVAERVSLGIASVAARKGQEEGRRASVREA
jgi:hypothetical protein